MTAANSAATHLDSLSKIPDNPVLFVPGALTGEWIWKNNFQCFFDQQGFTTHTMSFSGHEEGAFLERNRITFERYLEECVWKIRSLEKPPIIIAHSLGGLIAMHAATRVDVHSMVLLSPVPHTGVASALTQLGRKSPVSLLKLMSVVVDARIAKHASPPIGIYSETCDEESSAEATSKLRSESLPVMLRLLAPPKLDQARIDADRILFMGATGDHIIPPSEVLKSAKTLGLSVKVYEGLSHTFQVENEWPMLAEEMVSWITELE